MLFRSNGGSGYIATNTPPIVQISPPTPIREEISNVTYSGDFGIIVGVATTSVGVASTGIVFDFLIPKDSPLREILYAGIGVTDISGIQTGYYFVVRNSNIGSPSSGRISYTRSNNQISIGGSYLDNIYEACGVAITTKNIVGYGTTSPKAYPTGIGVTYINNFIARVTVSVNDNSGLVGLSTGFYGEFSWGLVTITERPKAKSFNAYNSSGISGIYTSPILRRVNPLRYIGYTTTV